jgi:CTP synthase
LPDLIACRCENPLDTATIDKVARFCQVPSQHVLAVRDMPSTYQVPILLSEQNLIPLMTSTLQLDRLTISPTLRQKGTTIWETWKNLTLGLQHLHETVEVTLVGKYLEQPDSYLSVVRSLEHAAMRCRRKLTIRYVDAEHLEPATNKADPASYHKAWHDVCTAKGILVPGGFGTRGTEGMIAAANWARHNRTPYLGICLGMQIAVIEFARNVVGIEKPQASSHEFDDEVSFNPIPKPLCERNRREVALECVPEHLRLGYSTPCLACQALNHGSTSIHLTRANVPLLLAGRRPRHHLHARTPPW